MLGPMLIYSVAQNTPTFYMAVNLIVISPINVETTFKIFCAKVCYFAAKIKK